jgi:hypothetical protein
MGASTEDIVGMSTNSISTSPPPEAKYEESTCERGSHSQNPVPTPASAPMAGPSAEKPPPGDCPGFDQKAD